MKRAALLIALLLIPNVALSRQRQQRQPQPQPSVGYNANCNCQQCQLERKKRAALSVKPVTAKTTPAAPKAVATPKAESIKPAVKASPLESTQDSGISPIGIDLISAYPQSRIKPIDVEQPEPAVPFYLVQTTPAVKSDEEETVEAAELPPPPTLPQEQTFELSAPSQVDSKFQIPAIAIVGAERAIPVGEMVQLGVKLDSKPKDLHSVSYTWTILPRKPFIVWPDGTQIIFGTGTQSQNYTAILTASFVYVVKEGDKIIEVAQRSVTNTATVQIGGGSLPNPDPTDPPDPDGDLLGLSKQAFEWVALVSRTNAYTEANVKADAKKLAASFTTVSTAIDAGTYADVAAIMKATKESNDQAFENRNEWLPWFSKMSIYLQQAYNSGAIRTPQQYAVAWRDIAKGLDSF